MRHGLQLASIALLRLVGLNIDWGCLVPHCIMDSLDQWKFLPFFGPQWQSLCTALMAGNACRWGCARGLCTSLLHTPIKVTSPTGHKCHHRMLAAVHHEKSPSNYIVALRHVMLGKHDKALMVSYATFEKISFGQCFGSNVERCRQSNIRRKLKKDNTAILQVFRAQQQRQK